MRSWVHALLTEFSQTKQKLKKTTNDVRLRKNIKITKKYDSENHSGMRVVHVAGRAGHRVAILVHTWSACVRSRSSAALGSPPSFCAELSLNPTATMGFHVETTLKTWTYIFAYFMQRSQHASYNYPRFLARIRVRSRYYRYQVHIVLLLGGLSELISVQMNVSTQQVHLLLKNYSKLTTYSTAFSGIADHSNQSSGCILKSRCKRHSWEVTMKRKQPDRLLC